MSLDLTRNAMLKNLSDAFFFAPQIDGGNVQEVEPATEGDLEKSFADYLAMALTASTFDEAGRQSLLTDPLNFIPENAAIGFMNIDELDTPQSNEADDSKINDDAAAGNHESSRIEIAENLDGDIRLPNFWRHNFVLTVIEQTPEPANVALVKGELPDKLPITAHAASVRNFSSIEQSLNPLPEVASNIFPDAVKFEDVKSEGGTDQKAPLPEFTKPASSVIEKSDETVEPSTQPASINIRADVEANTVSELAQQQAALNGQVTVATEQETDESDDLAHSHDSKFAIHFDADTETEAEDSSVIPSRKQDETRQPVENTIHAHELVGAASQHDRSSTPASNTLEKLITTPSKTASISGADHSHAVVEMKRGEQMALFEASNQIAQEPSHASDPRMLAQARASLVVDREEPRPRRSDTLNQALPVNSFTLSIGNNENQPVDDKLIHEQQNGRDAASLFDKQTTESAAGLHRSAATEKSATRETVAPSSQENNPAAILHDRGAVAPSTDSRSILPGQIEKTASPGAPLVHAKDFVGWVVNRAAMITENGRTEVELRLEPETLGAVKIKMDIIADTMTTRMEVQNVQAKELVESRLPVLQQKLLENGIRTDKIEVTLAPALARLETPPASTFDLKNSLPQSSSQGQRHSAPNRQHQDRQTRNNGQKTFLDLMG